jgi:hypothetical protein
MSKSLPAILSLSGAFDEPGSSLVRNGPLLSLLIVLLAIYPVVYVSAFCHELGHALLARWNGFLVTSFGMGIGRPLWVGSWRGSRVYVCRQKPLQGITFSVMTQLYPTRRQLVAMLAGGVLANFALAAVAFLLWRLLPWGGEVWATAGLLNAALAVGNLVPFNSRVGTTTLRTDGGLIWQVLRGRTAVGEAPERLERLAALRGLWESVGDHLGLWVHVLGAAAAWRDLGDVERAEALCAEAEALPLEATPFTRAYGAVVRAAVLRAAGKFADCAALLDAAEQGFRDLGHEAGLFLTAWGRAELLLQQGRAAEAVAALDELAGHRLVATRPGLRFALLESRLCARATLPDGDGVEPLRREYERYRAPLATRDLRVYRGLARLHVRREEWERAAEAYRTAVAAVRKLYGLLAKSDDGRRFAQGQADLLAEAGTCLRRVGADAEADKLAGALTADTAGDSAAADRQRRGRRLHRAAWALTAVNAVCAVALVAAVWVLECRAVSPGLVLAPTGERLVLKHPPTAREFFLGLPLFVEARVGRAWGIFLTCLVIGVVLVPLVSALLAAGGRLLPAVRGRGGSLIFWLALMPWLGWLLYVLLAPIP